MNKITSTNIFAEVHNTLKDNFKYIINKLWFVITIYLVSLFVCMLLGSYDGLFWEYLEVNYLPPEISMEENIWLALMGLSVLLLLAISNLNIINYMIELGLKKTITPTGFYGLRFTKKELKLILIIGLVIIFSGLFAVIPFFLASIFGELHIDSLAIFFIILTVFCFVGMFNRLILAVPIGLTIKGKAGIRTAFRLTKGYGGVVIGIVFYNYVIGKVGNLFLLSGEPDLTTPTWIYKSIAAATIGPFYGLLCISIAALVPPTFYKLLKEQQMKG